MSPAKRASHGGSQAVLLPKECLFEGTGVHARRDGSEVVLSAQPPADMQGMLIPLDGFELGARAQREQPAEQERTAIEPRC